jgi:heavy metal sensor kinase
MTIRTRLTLWYSGLLTMIIVTFGIALIAVLNWAWIDQTQVNLMKVATQTLQQLEVSPDGRMRAQLPDMTEMVGYGTFFIQIWDVNGKIIDRSNPNILPPLDRDKLGSTERQWSDVQIGDKHFFVLTQPFYTPLDARPNTIQIGTRLDQIDLAVNRLIRIMIGIGAIAIVLSLMIGSMIAGRALRPIDTIAQAATRITAADDLSRRIPYHGPNDELGMLTVTFNATLERLERLFNSQRRFVADVSHELRTPLTTLQGNLDLIRRFGPDKEAMEAMTSEIGRMTRLVSDLLLLARADSGNLPMKKQLIDLDTQVLEVFREGRILGPQHEIKLEKIVPARINADPDRIKQLLLNLVTNAIKYTPVGGTVTINMTVKNGYAFVSVTDTGIGIPANDLELIFERFYRVDKARSREAGGTGLGLSIAQWIVRSHGGTITATSEEGKGSTFTVQLPVVDTDTPPESQIQTRTRIPALNRSSNSKRQTQPMQTVKPGE